MKGFVFLSVLFLPIASQASEGESWHLLTQRYSGEMQLIKKLTKEECEFMRARAMGEPATEAEKEADRKKKEEARIAQEEREKKQAIVDAEANGQCKGKKDEEKITDTEGHPRSCYQGKSYAFGWSTIGYYSSVSAPTPYAIKAAECFE